MPHIHEKIDFTVSVFIVAAGKVLLVNHPRYNLWLPIGGHVELDEDPDEALFREIKEESGLKDVEILSHKPILNDSDRKALYTPNYMDIHYANPPHKHIALVYFGRASNNRHVKSDEHTEAKWFSIAELDDSKYNFAADIKFYSKEAIRAATQSRDE